MTQPWELFSRRYWERLVRQPSFVRWASRFPLTRPIARRRAGDLFDLAAGFVYSQVLSACIQLNLFEIVAENPKTPDQLAPLIGLNREQTEKLLTAACSLNLLKRRAGDRFGLGHLGSAVLANPGVAEMVRHHALFYSDLSDPVRLMREPEMPTNLADFWAYAKAQDKKGLVDDQTRDYSALMAASQAFIADEVLSAFPLTNVGCLLDVGGGEGAFVCEAAKQSTNSQFILFDLPSVAERAQARFETERIADRAKAIGGDFFADSLPKGADAVSFIRVIHDHDDESALRLLASAKRALPPGGTLLLAEPMSGTSGVERMGDAYFAFYLLAMKSGKPRTRQTLSDMLSAVGFQSIRPLATNNPIICSVLVAKA